MKFGRNVLQVNMHRLTVRFSTWRHILKMAATMSFCAEKCCHLVSEHGASALCLCSSICQFLIYSTFVLALWLFRHTPRLGQVHPNWATGKCWSSTNTDLMPFLPTKIHTVNQVMQLPPILAWRTGVRQEIGTFGIKSLARQRSTL